MLYKTNFFESVWIYWSISNKVLNSDSRTHLIHVLQWFLTKVYDIKMDGPTAKTVWPSTLNRNHLFYRSSIFITVHFRMKCLFSSESKSMILYVAKKLDGLNSLIFSDDSMLMKSALKSNWMKNVSTAVSNSRLAR